MNRALNSVCIIRLLFSRITSEHDSLLSAFIRAKRDGGDLIRFAVPFRVLDFRFPVAVGAVILNAARWRANSDLNATLFLELNIVQIPRLVWQVLATAVTK